MTHPDWPMFDDLLRVRDASGNERPFKLTEAQRKVMDMPYVTMTRTMYENYKKAVDDANQNRMLRSAIEEIMLTGKAPEFHVGVDHGIGGDQQFTVLLKRETSDWPERFVFCGYPKLYWTPIKDALFDHTPPGVSIHRRNSGAIVVTVNLKRGGFTCFLRPASRDASGQSTETDAYDYGLAFRAPTDAPTSKGKDMAARRCGRWRAGTSRTPFAGEVDARRHGLLIYVQSAVLRALRDAKKRGALRSVRWWSDASMREAAELLNGYKESVESVFPRHPDQPVVTMVPLDDEKDQT